MIDDKAFIDRAEELGIKDLLAAFAASLVSGRTAAELRVRPSENGFLITTLNITTCTCGAVLSMGDKAGLVPQRPHTSECAWSRFMLLFGDEATKAEFGRTKAQFRNWALGIDAHPDNHAYRLVVIAREFLDQEHEQELKKKENP